MGSSNTPNEVCSIKKEKKRRTREVEKRGNVEREREREGGGAMCSALCGSVGALVATATCGDSGPLSLA
jgi:hypothetical protein